MSFYIAKGIEAIKKISGIKYQITPMGTILESQNIDKIYESAKTITEIVHNLGVNRVEVIMKIDSRNDKNVNLEEKIQSIKNQLKE